MDIILSFQNPNQDHQDHKVWQMENAADCWLVDLAIQFQKHPPEWLLTNETKYKTSTNF